MIKLYRFKRADTTSWRINDLVDPIEFPLNISISYNNFKLLSWGDIPESMDNHWFGYLDKSKYNLYRSWTGIKTHELYYKKFKDYVYFTHALVGHVWWKFENENEFESRKFIEHYIDKIPRRNKSYMSKEYLNWLIKEYDGVELIS